MNTIGPAVIAFALTLASQKPDVPMYRIEMVDFEFVIDPSNSKRLARFLAHTQIDVPQLFEIAETKQIVINAAHATGLKYIGVASLEDSMVAENNDYPHCLEFSNIDGAPRFVAFKEPS